MAFEWKNSKDIFKGPGIYHLTFAVAGRRPLLGELVRILDSSLSWKKVLKYCGLIVILNILACLIFELLKYLVWLLF